MRGTFRNYYSIKWEEPQVPSMSTDRQRNASSLVSNSLWVCNRGKSILPTSHLPLPSSGSSYLGKGSAEGGVNATQLDWVTQTERGSSWMGSLPAGIRSRDGRSHQSTQHPDGVMIKKDSACPTKHSLQSRTTECRPQGISKLGFGLIRCL